MGESIEVRRRRLLHRCRYTGMRETDILLGAFAERHLAGLDAAGLDRLERLLDAGDANIHAWAVGTADVPAEHDTDVFRLVKTFQDKG